MTNTTKNLYLVAEGIVYSVGTATEERMVDDYDGEYQVKLATRDLQVSLSNHSDWILVAAPSAQNALNFATYNDANCMRENILRRKHSDLEQYRSILLFDGEGYRPKFVDALLDRMKTEKLGDLHPLDLIGEYSPWIYNWRRTWESPASIALVPSTDINNQYLDRDD